MTLDELKALDVPAAPDTLLYMWVTNPKTSEALELLNAWGFTHRTNMVWVKDKIGMGYWARQRSELLFIATRGKNPPSPPPPELRRDSVIEYRRLAHSAKPPLYDLFDELYPDLTKIELFARNVDRLGWDTWGAEA